MLTTIELVVLLPILTVLAIAFGAPARLTALLGAGGTLLLGLLAASQFRLDYEGEFQLVRKAPLEVLNIDGFPTLSLDFGVDGISLVLVLLTALVLLAAIWVSPGEREIEKKGSARLYYICSLLIGAGAMGAFCSTDLFFLYAFHELALIPTFLMIGLFGKGERRERIKTAWTITIYLGIGSIILLLGLVAMVMHLGAESFEIDVLIARARGESAIAAGSQSWIFLLLLVGFGILVSLFPFHSWAPSAYASAPTPVAMLHAGVLKKFGLYGLVRVAMPILPEGAQALGNVILILLLGNILFIGLVTIAQGRLDKMLGYSSVMHMGYAFLGIASGTKIGMIGAVMLMFGHGVSIALLFALSDSIERRFGTLDLERLGGIAKLVPGLGLLFGFAAFASAGLPGFANFASEVLIFFGAFEPYDGVGKFGALQWAAILSLWGVVISAVYMLRAYRSVFKGLLPSGLDTSGAARLSWGEKIPLLLLLVPLMAVGFVPEILLKYLRPAIDGISLTLGG